MWMSLMAFEQPLWLNLRFKSRQYTMAKMPVFPVYLYKGGTNHTKGRSAVPAAIWLCVLVLWLWPSGVAPPGLAPLDALIFELPMLEMRSNFYKDVLLEDTEKHQGLYLSWSRHTSDGMLYVTDAGKCTGYFSYNDKVGNQVAVNRPIPDTRPQGCASLIHGLDTGGLRVSVVIPFHNEQLSTLLRTLHSVVQRSPRDLLKEVILVDDFSSPGLICTQEMLERAVWGWKGLVRVIRTTQREGSTRARIIGASYATADIISYLDSHVEVNKEWLQPIVAHIYKNRHAVVMSVLDTIDTETFKIQGAGFGFHGGFNWNLEFYWKGLPDHLLKQRHSELDPVPSPIMPAGAFALDKEFYMHLGLLDPDMRIWGVDDVEFSFRTWQCGGTVEILPCSRVGHIFRPHIPYSFGAEPSKVIYHNSIRTAEVVLGDYKKFFYAQARQYSEVKVNETTLQQRQHLKKNLGCKDILWFMNNIIPEMPIPPSDAVYYEHIMPINNQDSCVQMSAQRSQIAMAPCFPLKQQQFFYINTAGQFRYLLTEQCLHVINNNTLVLSDCNKLNNIKWNYNKKLHRVELTSYDDDMDEVIVHCLSRLSSGHIHMTLCNPEDNHVHLKWRFTYNFDWTKPLKYVAHGNE